MRETLPRKDFLANYLSLFIILILNAIFLSRHLFQGFNFFDMGPFLDASWRVYTGERPYIDFIYTTGPIYLYLNALSFLLFGFSKTAIWFHVVLVHSVVIISTFLIAKKYASSFTSYLTAILTTACFYWPISFPWYDQTAHLWGILGVVVLVYWDRPEESFRAGLVCGILAALSFFSKSNIGVFYSALFLASLAIKNSPFSGIKGFLIGFSGSALVMLVIIGAPQKYIEQSFLLYNNTPEHRLRRIAALFRPEFWLMDFYWAAFLIVVLNGFKSLKAVKFTFILFIGVFFVARLSTATGSMLPGANIPLLGVLMALGFGVIAKSGSKISKWTHNALIAVTVMMIIFSTSRGLKREAWTYNGRNAFGNYTLQKGPFAGWKVDDLTGRAVDDLVSAFEFQVPKTDSVLILTDLQILNPLTGHKSYTGIPFIWAVNEVPARGKQVEEVRNHILKNPPDWIVTHVNAEPNSDIAFIIPYLGLQDFVLNSYSPVQTFGNYVVAKKND